MIESLPYSKQIFDLYLKGITLKQLSLVLAHWHQTPSSHQLSKLRSSRTSMTGFLCLQGRGNYVKYFCIFLWRNIDCDCCGCLAPDVGLDDVFVLQRLGLIWRVEQQQQPGQQDLVLLQHVSRGTRVTRASHVSRLTWDKLPESWSESKEEMSPVLMIASTK